MHQVMYHNFAVDKAHEEFLRMYFLENDAHFDNICCWRGVQCTNGVVTAFTIVSGFTRSWLVDTDCFPSTMQYVHLKKVSLIDEWLPRRLPRALVYFFTDSKLASGIESRRKIDVRQLPQKMEELHIHNGWFAGKVQIFDLPPSMRFSHIRNTALHRAYIDTQRLPSTLKHLNIVNVARNNVITFTNDVVSYRRVTEGYEDFIKFSEVCREF